MQRSTSWLRPRFSLRLLLVATTVSCLALALNVHRAQSQRGAIDALTELSDQTVKISGVRIRLIYDTDNTGTSVPEWLLEGVGRDHFHSVVALDLDLAGGEEQHGKTFSQAIELMRGLPRLRELRLNGPTCLDIERIHRLDGKIDHLRIQRPSFSSPELSNPEFLPQASQFIEEERLDFEASQKRTAEYRRTHPDLTGMDRTELNGRQLEKLLTRRARSGLTREINRERFYTNLTNLAGVTELTLIGVETTYRQEGVIESIFSQIARCSALKTLRLWSCYFDGRELAPLGEANELEFLSIQNSVTGYQGVGRRFNSATGEMIQVLEGGYYEYTPFHDGSRLPIELEAETNATSDQAPTEEEWLKELLPNVKLDSFRMYGS